LTQAPGAEAATDATAGRDSTVRTLEQKVKAGSRHDTLLDHSLRRLPGITESVPLPAHLISRAHKLLEQGRGLLDRLRRLGDALPPESEDNDPAAQWYRTTVAMADTALRMIGTFPDAPSVQLRLCEGIEATLSAVASRVARLAALLERRRQDTAWVETLASCFTSLQAGGPADDGPLQALAEEILAEHHNGGPLRFFSAPPQQPSRYVACHGLNVAQVIARVIRNAP